MKLYIWGRGRVAFKEFLKILPLELDIKIIYLGLFELLTELVFL